MAAYNKIFFQSGPTGNVPGWGQFVEEANRKGIPVAAAVTDTTSLLDDMKTHGRKYKVPNRGNFIPTGYLKADEMKKVDPNWQQAWGDYHLSVPIYAVYGSRDEAEKTYQRAAKLHMDAVETRIPAGLDREMVSVSTWNEIRPYKGWGSAAELTADDWKKQTPGYGGWGDAIGRQAYWIGKELVRRKQAGEKWFRWAAFGFAGGNPEPGVWETPGMLDYLRLAGQHPDVLGLALHEYCFTFDIWRGFEEKTYIGRFEQLFAVCDKHQIPRPWVEIKEWGWKEDDIPDKAEAMKQLGAVAQYYARFPQIQLAALWTANGGWRDASKKVPSLAQEIYQYTLATAFPDPKPGPIVKLPIDKLPNDDDNTPDEAVQPKVAVQLLQNGGFEDDWGVEKSHKVLQIDAAGLHEMEVGNIFTPPHWLVYFYHKEEELAQPEVRDARQKERTFAGEKGQVFFTFNRRHHGGFLQTVATVPGQVLSLTAVAHAWSNHKDEKLPDRFPHPDDPKWSDGVGYGGHYILKGDTKPTDDDAVRNFTFRVGIDPTGGRDPRSDKVVWGEEAHIYNEYHTVPLVSTKATGSKATVFLESQTLWPLKHNDAYWDEAQLWQGAPQADDGDATQKPKDDEKVVVTEEKVWLRQVLTAVSDPINTLHLIVKKRDGTRWKTERTIALPIDADTQIELHYIQQLTAIGPKDGTDRKGGETSEDKKGGEEGGSQLGDLRDADTRKRLLGMDISESQNPQAIKYDKLKDEGIVYAFLRACRGSSVKDNGYWVADTTYDTHFAKLGKVGILRGSYHVLYEWDPEGQAQKFFDIYKPGELPPVLDIEKGQYTGKLTAVIAQRFLKKWEELGGERPIIYTNQSTWNEMMGSPNWSTDYKLWVASYDADGDNPYAMPKPWGKQDWSFWQYTQTERLKAYDNEQSNIDLNWFNGRLVDLYQLGGTSPKDIDGDDESGSEEEGLAIEGVLLEKGFDALTDAEGEPEPINLLEKKIDGGVMLNVAFRSQKGPGANKYTGDCGPTCVAMIAESVTGKPVAPDDLMARLGKTSKVAQENYTGFDDLTKALSWHDIKVEKKERASLTQIEGYLRQGQPVISLIKYGAMEKSARANNPFQGWHFIVLIGFDESHLYFRDPLQVKETISQIARGNFMEATQADKEIKPGQQILVISAKEPLTWVKNLPDGYIFMPAPASLAAKMEKPRGKLATAWIYLGGEKATLIRKGKLAEVNSRYVNVRNQPKNVKGSFLNKVVPGQTMLLTGRYANGYAEVRLVLPVGVLDDEDKPEDKQPPKGKLIDLLEYMRGDGRIYDVQHSSGGTETFQTQTQGNKFYFVKNNQWEELWADDEYIWRGLDTSPGPAPKDAERPGKVRYYKQFEAGKDGARWAKRHMAVGETFKGSGHTVQFYYKSDGQKSAKNSGGATNKVTLVAFHESKTWGKNTIQGVIELKTSTGETMFFGKGWGLVAWGSEWGHSEVMTKLEGRTPNKREIIR